MGFVETDGFWPIRKHPWFSGQALFKITTAAVGSATDFIEN